VENVPDAAAPIGRKPMPGADFQGMIKVTQGRRR